MPWMNKKLTAAKAKQSEGGKLAQFYSLEIP
jgi:hypothetical protein